MQEFEEWFTAKRKLQQVRFSKLFEQLAPSPPSESADEQVTKPTAHSLRSSHKPLSSYTLRGSRPIDSKKNTATEAESSFLSTPSSMPLDSTVTIQSTRAAFRTKSSYRSRQVGKPTIPDTENVVTAPGTSEAQDSSSRPTFRRGFTNRGRSATYKSHPTRSDQGSTSTEDNSIPVKTYTARPSFGKTRTTSGFRRSVTATMDDVQNSVQTSTQLPVTPPSLVGPQRFSARFRSDLLLATGGLKSTTTPAYIPTVPLIRAASTATIETPSSGPGKWSTNGGRPDSRTRSARVNLL